MTFLILGTRKNKFTKIWRQSFLMHKSEKQNFVRVPALFMVKVGNNWAVEESYYNQKTILFLRLYQYKKNDFFTTGWAPSFCHRVLKKLLMLSFIVRFCVDFWIRIELFLRNFSHFKARKIVSQRIFNNT